MYRDMFRNALFVFEEKYGRNLVTAFKKFQDLGKLEIITCAATHGFLPLMQNQNAVRAQILVAVEQHTKHLGRAPKGIWLPECGYYPGLDEILKEAGIRFFFTGLPRPVPRIAPAEVRRLCARLLPLGRGRLRPGHRIVQAGLELRRGISRGLRLPGFLPGHRVRPGLRVCQALSASTTACGSTWGSNITGSRERRTTKSPTSGSGRSKGRRSTRAISCSTGRSRSNGLSGMFKDRKPIIVAPYDAELFGHWWFEGPDWLNFLIRKIACDQETIRLITPTEYLDGESGDARLPTPPFPAGATRDMPRYGWTGPMTGSTAICTRPPNAWSSLRAAFPGGRGPAEAGVEPGGAGTAPRAELGLGLHHEDRQPRGIRGQEDQGPCPPLHQAL